MFIAEEEVIINVSAATPYSAVEQYVLDFFVTHFRERVLQVRDGVMERPTMLHPRTRQALGETIKYAPEMGASVMYSC